MKEFIKKYCGLMVFYVGVIVLTLSIVNYLEQQKSTDSQISYHIESVQPTFVK